MKNELVFLIDDDEEDCMLFELALGEARPATQLHCAHSCDSAMGQLATLAQQPLTIFLDMNLPTRSGIDCLQLLKENAALSAVPVVVYSGSLSKKETEEALALGASEVLLKASTYHELVQQLAKVLNR